MNKLSYSKIESGIYVKNLYILKDGVLSKKEDKYIINSYNLFKLTVDLGEKLLKGTLDNNELIRKFNNYGLPITDIYVNYKIDIWIDRIKDLIKDIYLFISISIKCNKIIEAKKFYKEKFKTLFDDLNNIDWINRFNDSIESNRFNVDEINDFLMNQDKIHIDDKDEICYFIKYALTNYINGEYSKFPITMSLVKKLNDDNLNIEYGFFRTCDNVLGLIYFEVLNHIVPNKINATYTGCDYCGGLFTKYGNTKYCKTCRDNGIPEWIKSQKYEESDKGKATRASYKEKRKKNKG